MIGRLLIVDRNRLADHFAGGLETPGLEFDHPQQMQAFGMLGIDYRNLPVNPLSLGQSACLVVPESIRQYLLNDWIRP